ncbi:hypothetical protein, conserved [Angomonas deanei]|uniref:Uncharacterized protein n=1 Tax=Angomonas deanei TaxID=59799 RepID=A0A7G2C5A2_9TRYP|nr:hypothetical protein, conserved [Angomonas deanei]
MLRSGKFDPLIREAVDHLRKSKSCWERWDGLRASLMISVTQQDTDAINDDRAVFLTTALDSIDTLLTDVKTEAQRIGSLPPGCIPSACLEEAALLLWKAKFAGKNLFLIEGATQNYRMLSMDNLNLLKTNAPKELEDNVLQFMRDPLKKGGAESDLGVLQSSWFSPSPKVGDEVLNALQHFHISLREEAVRNCQRFYVQESAISSANLLQGKHYVNQCEALWINMQLAHQRLFELRAEAADFQQHAGKLSAATVEKVWQLFEEEFTAVPAADGGKSHKGKPRDDVPRLQSSNVNCNEALITQCFRTIVSDCLLRLDYASLSKVYLLLADLLALWNRYQAVGYAVEKAQAAALFAHLFSINRQHYASGKESVLVHTYASLVELDSGRLGSTHCSEVFAELLEESPLVAQAHASLAFPEKLDMMGDPLTECATLSIVRSPADERVMYVALRLPDGTLRTRRTVLDESGLLDWYKKYDRFLSFKHDEASGEEAVASFNLDELLEELDRLAAPLWGGLDSLIKSHGIKHTLYLCLDPCLQKYPLEQISSFSMFHSVARELSASTVAKKLTQKTTKTTGSSLFIIDPAGDCTNACDSIVNTETKQKSSNIITCKDSKYPVSDPFLVFSLGDKRCTSMYLHTDGDLRFVFTTPMIANVNLSHVQTCTIVSDGMSDAVQRREQRELLTCEGPLRTDQRWESYLLLLARGVRWLLANSLPSTSANNIALAKRVFSQISSGRGLETKESKAKDTKKQSMIVYGVQPTLPKKQ